MALAAIADAPTKEAKPKEARAPTYFLIPLQGFVGKEIIAKKIKDAMEAGLKDKQTVLVLEIDSPGGLISECEKIIALLAAEKERRTIAFIKNAYSAAAMISLTCDEIYMAENAAIGSATAVFINPSPPPKENPPNAPQGKGGENKPAAPAAGMVEAPEKLQSVWRSVCRRAAELGGHEPLLAEAMADHDVQLRLVVTDGKKTVQQFLQPDEEDVAKNRIIKNRGKLLTLTAREAVNCGLAAGIAGQAAGIESKAGGLAGWKPVSNRGERIMALYRTEVKKAEDQVRDLITKVGDEFRRAIENDPGAVPNEIYASRAKRCYEHLLNCEKALKRIGELGTTYPFLEQDAREAQEKKAEIQTIRARLKRDAARRSG